jgi:hypothetical protein
LDSLGLGSAGSVWLRAAVGGGDLLVMADDFLDHEVQELFREVGVEIGFLAGRASP